MAKCLPMPMPLELKSNSSSVDMTMRPRIGDIGALALFSISIIIPWDCKLRSLNEHSNRPYIVD
jgi:hypothetical protein